MLQRLRSFTAAAIALIALFTLSAGAETILFKAPNTLQGWTGQSAPVAHGKVMHPRGPQLKPSVNWEVSPGGADWSEENLDAAFWEPTLGKVAWLTTINDAPNFGPTFDYASFWLSTSTDGANFPLADWHEIFWVDPKNQNLRIHHPNVFADARNTSMYSVLFSVTEKQGGITTRFTARAAIHLGLEKYKVKTTTGWSTWRNWGDQMTETLEDVGAVPGTRMTFADGEYQQWWGRNQNVDPATTSRIDPCEKDASAYAGNTVNHYGGRFLGHKVYDWNAGQTGSRIEVNLPQPGTPHKDLWTDYGGHLAHNTPHGQKISSIHEARLWDFGTTTVLYMSSADRRACTLPISGAWNPWYGMGIKALVMNRETDGSYSLVSSHWLLDIGESPNTESWGCASNPYPGFVCTTSDKKLYSFSGVIPVQIPTTGQVYFYTPIWGGFTFD